jgi:TetR/AcrR family acrAB operon transcriptional repressor
MSTEGTDPALPGTPPARSGRLAEIGDESRRRLLDAAEELFAERGFDKTSFADVGERSGISRGSIPWHFGNKAGLLWAVVERAAQQWRELYTPSPDPVGLGRAVQDAKVQVRTPRASLLFMVAGEALETDSPIHDNYRDWHRAIRTHVAEWIATARAGAASSPSGDDEALATTVLGALIGLNLQWHVDPDGVDVDRALDALAALVRTAVWPDHDRRRRPRTARAGG